MILRLYILSFLIFLFAPIVIIILFSFNSTPSLVFPIESLSFRWYEALADNPSFLASLINSLKVGFGATIVTTILGTLTGLAMIRMAKRSKMFLEFLSLAPIGLPGLFLGIALVTFFAQAGLPRSLVTVTIGHVLFTYPFFVETMRSRVVYFDQSVEEAARDLGASPLQAFWLVTIPILRPTIIGAAILTFALSFDEFLITVFVSGNDTTLPTFILSMMRRTIDPSINAASVIALAMSLVIIAIGGLYIYLRRTSDVGVRKD